MKLLGLDIGEKRIGVAKGDSGVKIASPVGMIPVDGGEFQKILKLVRLGNIEVVVVGMPRNLQGELTKQSEYVKTFVKSLNRLFLAEKPNGKTVKIFLQDESLTSVEAKANLKNKKGGINKKAGDVDAEAATLILQDFLENLDRRLRSAPKSAQNAPSKPAISPKPPLAASPAPATPTPPQQGAPATNPAQKPPKASKNKPQFEPYAKTTAKKWLLVRVFLIILVVLGLAFLGTKLWYNASLAPLIALDKCPQTVADGEANPCLPVEIEVSEGATVSSIASLLKSANLIRSPLAFEVYARLNHVSADLKAGPYLFAASESVEEIIEKLKTGATNEIVFRFTSLPGETMQDIKKRLLSIGYSEAEIDAAFAKKYDHPVLADKPAEASLEGYLFGETYEFYNTDSVETIVIRMLDELYTVVEKNNLRQKFNNLGLTLHEGIILASVVQKEAGTLTKDDQKTVASVFWNRLSLGIPLGSDVTVKYALDLVDPNRETYQDNASALQIDSCYNTRKYAGLPCGAISNPSALVLISTANPADTSYLYFLTGDDGMMYYSSTESEHLNNISAHCQELCNVQL